MSTLEIILIVVTCWFFSGFIPGLIYQWCKFRTLEMNDLIVLSICSLFSGPFLNIGIAICLVDDIIDSIY